MSDTALTVVVPTFNQSALLAACLRSLDEQTLPPDQVIVVDDGSDEDIGAIARAAFPEVRVIRMERNGGFCRAANAGLRAADTPYALLLNNDMTLARDCIAALMRDADPRAIRTPLVLFSADPGTIYCAGDRVLTNGRPEPIGFRERRDGFALPDRIFGCTGGAALISQDVFRAIGYFDETFVAYFEDADFCMRARWAGFECALVADAAAYHVGSASLGGKTWWRSRQCFRNHGLLVLKHFPLAAALRYYPAIVRERLHQASMALSSARAEFGLLKAIGVLVGAAASLAAAVPRAIGSRLRRRRTISGREFAALLTPAVRR